jgi:glycosyltransferase involved in cell wall biosynthesis
MHLALLTPEWYEGEGAGIATYCRIFATHAESLGHEVTVLAATEREHVRERVATRIEVLPVIAKHKASVLERASAFRDAWRSIAKGVDAVEAAEFGAVAALITDEAPVTTRLHTPLALLLERNGGWPIYRDDSERCELEARQVRASRLVTSPTTWLASEAERLWQVDARVIPNPVERPSEPPRIRARSHPLRVLYFGRLEHRKGVLTLAEAARPLLGSGTIALTLIGNDTQFRGESIRERVERTLAPHRARILLPRQGAALVSLIDESDLIVLPSLFENFAYACVEAMSRAKCVIATSGSGFNEIIDDGRTGVLVPPGAAAPLHDAIKAAAMDARDLDGIGRAAWSSLSRFDPKTIVNKLSKAYAEAMQNS